MNGARFCGIVSRIHDGSAFKILLKKRPFDNPEVAELFAVLQALLLGRDMGWRSVICEHDTKNLIDSLNSSEKIHLHWLTETFFADINYLLWSFYYASFCWILRAVNQLTHVLCKWPLNSCTGGCWPISLMNKFFIVTLDQEMDTCACLQFWFTKTKTLPFSSLG